MNGESDGTPLHFIKEGYIMSNFHIREQSLDEKTIRIVCHISVPGTGNNAALIQWRTVLMNYMGGASQISSIVPEVQGTQEETDMKAGAVYEKDETYRFSKLGLSQAQKNAEISAWYNNKKDEIWSDMQKILLFFGHTP